MKNVVRFIALLGISAVAATAEWPVPPQSTCYYSCYNPTATPKHRNYAYRTTQEACCSAQCPAGWMQFGLPSWGDPPVLCNSPVS